ncbi:MAG TPA: IucA/IucC family protein [Pyrinomonadaceae bacterium]|nr:IucA/IucC family protein [Pyrinomonadaceae bacterium]
MDETRIFGKIPDEVLPVVRPDPTNFHIPLHPDMLPRCAIDWQDVSNSSFYCYPTASGRTLDTTIEERHMYLKLHYDGVLCRVNRSLPEHKAIAGVEVSEELSRASSNSLLPQSFSFFPEVAAITHTGKYGEIACVLRNATPFPQTRRSHALIPFFSLFSRDIRSQTDPSLLEQILSASSTPKNLLLDNVILWVLESYVAMVRVLGLIPEINAQNILLAVDGCGSPCGVVLRDLMGVEKDVDARTRLGLTTAFKAGQYKKISREMDEGLYYVRHSFSYDFKLCHYVIEPLIRDASASFGWSVGKLAQAVRKLFITQFGEERFSYFVPYDKWFSHPKVMLTHNRPYVSNSRPLYR